LSAGETGRRSGSIALQNALQEEKAEAEHGVTDSRG
jgi:hypothetical protein